MYALSVLIYLCLFVQGISSISRNLKENDTSTISTNKTINNYPLATNKRKEKNLRNKLECDESKESFNQINAKSAIDKLEKNIKRIQERIPRLENKISKRDKAYNIKYKTKENLKFIKTKLKYTRMRLELKENSLKRSINRQKKCRKIKHEKEEIGELKSISRGKKSLSNKLSISALIPNMLKLNRSQLEHKTLKHTLQRLEKNNYYHCSENCTCVNGFELINGSICKDIDECITNNGGCEQNCSNSLGSYKCSCPNGFKLGTDRKSCEDVNECIGNNGHGLCKGDCTNTFGSYKCGCNNLPGTILGEDQHKCKDINECIEDIDGCSHKCYNYYNGFTCSCPQGMILGSDEKTCKDINECDSDEFMKNCPYGCRNEIGGYSCLTKNETKVDDFEKNVICRPLHPIQNGYFTCYYLGEISVISRPRTQCKLNCRNGTTEVEHYSVICTSNGHWKSLEKDKNVSCP